MNLSALIISLSFIFHSFCEETANVDPIAFSINTADNSMVLGVNSNGEVLFYHYGGKVKDVDMFTKYKSYKRTDHGMEPHAYNTMGGRAFNEPALRVTHMNGDLNTELRYVSHTVKKVSENIEETIVTMKDKAQDFVVTQTYTAHIQENVITTQTTIQNNEAQPVTLHNYYASSISLKAKSFLLTHLWGGWALEHQVSHTLLTHGTKSFESRKGIRTTHTENPTFMLTLDSEVFSEDHGEVIAGALAWSGNFKMNFEIDEFDRLTVLSGPNPYAAEYHLDSKKSFKLPMMVYTYSTKGAGQASRNLHDWARNYGTQGKKNQVPTLLNSWEGAYFTFDAPLLKQMMDDTALMGLEMFVLDDGWFGNKYPRNDDKNGLGDWQVNVKKLPDGIDDLATYAHSKGIKFGIWIEPEMVNEKSELYEKHPEWIVQAPKRTKHLTRHQFVLDLSNPQVQDFVYTVFDETVQLSTNIDYIKWDANRHIENVGSTYLTADKQSHFWVDYTLGFYSVMERIRAKYPKIQVQACASGGGRVEYGALKYFDEVWTSDNTEALTRVSIQYGMSLFYPAAAMGSHVSAVPNHQTDNRTPLKFRFDIAGTGRMGMELQPKTMTDAEKAEAARYIESYKTYRDIVVEGDLYRIANPSEGKGFYSLMYVSKDKTRAVCFCYNVVYQARIMRPKFRLNGLDADMSYTVKELNVDKKRHWFDGETFTGGFLMEQGINPDFQKLYDSAVYLLEQKK
ncbi:putative Alpha-galactosidase AgaA [Blattamonas nauphoetae]|uniref:alpha-galactosidase n=1 Tax=Blattamonas nauphoetae TaxID=2049346 RepID=A0ABQ9X247_9EUKA|nr:putative Alpha-galactosidase AgaA [Blattamonas nauphoetae]